MQTSKKLLLIIGAVLILFLVTSLIVLRVELKREIDEYKPFTYKEVATAPFESLDFSGNWSVELFQGRDQEVGVRGLDNLSSNFKIDNINGTLIFQADTANNEKIPVRITTPSLRKIRARGNTAIFMNSFQSDADSTQVFLEDSVFFKSFGNKLSRITIITSGNPRLEFMKDPME